MRANVFALRKILNKILIFIELLPIKWSDCDSERVSHSKRNSWRRWFEKFNSEKQQLLKSVIFKLFKPLNF